MKRLTLILLFIEISSNSYSQKIPFDIYCNKEKITKNSFSGYFYPQEFEFHFNTQDTICKIKKGTIIYYYHSNDNKVVNIDSNKVVTNIQMRGPSMEVNVNKIIKYKEGEIVGIDTNAYSYTIIFNSTPEIKDDEIISINSNNNFVIKAGLEHIDPIKGIDYHVNSPLWEVTNILNPNDTTQIIKWELVLVRGFRPIFVLKNMRVDMETSAIVTKLFRTETFFASPFI